MFSIHPITKLQFLSHIYFFVHNCFRFGPDRIFVLWYTAQTDTISCSIDENQTAPNVHPALKLQIYNTDDSL